jgi:hypothetical protein
VPIDFVELKPQHLEERVAQLDDITVDPGRRRKLNNHQEWLS